MNRFEADLAELADGIALLKAEYNRYFAGDLARPPYDLQSRLQSLIRRRSAARLGAGRRPADQFRFSTLESSFHILTEMWKKNVRALEEGRPCQLQRRPPAPASDTPRATPDAGGSEREFYRTMVTIPEASPSAPQFRELYTSFLAAAANATGRPPSLSYRTFYDRVASRLLSLRRRTGTRRAVFRVVLVDNRPMLKLRSLA